MDREDKMTVQQLLNRAEMLVIKQLSQRKKPIKLTNDDKFALAFATGVEMHFKTDYNNGIAKATTIPCGVVWDGNEFCVYTQNE